MVVHGLLLAEDRTLPHAKQHRKELFDKKELGVGKTRRRWCAWPRRCPPLAENVARKAFAWCKLQRKQTLEQASENQFHRSQGFFSMSLVWLRIACWLKVLPKKGETIVTQQGVKNLGSFSSKGILGGYEASNITSVAKTVRENQTGGCGKIPHLRKTFLWENDMRSVAQNASGKGTVNCGDAFSMSQLIL